jgi:hypothetical protein
MFDFIAENWVLSVIALVVAGSIAKFLGNKIKGKDPFDYIAEYIDKIFSIFIRKK